MIYLINEDQHAKFNALHRHDSCSCRTMRHNINEHVKRYGTLPIIYLRCGC